MHVRTLGVSLVVTLLLSTAGAAAARAPHSSRHAHKASGPVLVVRGDQVSTDGVAAAVAKAWDETGDGRLEVQPFSTIDGIDKALSGQVDIAASARPAFAERSEEAGLTFTPVAWDALVLVTNVANPVSNLTLKQVHDIYYGQTTQWSTLGGGDGRIDLEGVFPKYDGVQFSFRRLLFGNGDNRVAVPRLLINIDSLQSDIALNTKGLALSTLAHARRQPGIKMLSIEGVQPSLATLENGSYPLPLTIYLAYKPDSTKLAQIQKFVAFLGGDKAGAILRSHALLPYAQATVLNAVSEVDRINTLGARMVAEGMPAEYAPGNEFARLAQQYPALAHSQRMQQAAAAQVAAADQQQIVLARAAGVAPAASANAAATDAPATDYTVVSGDTLSKIAHKHSVTVDDLRSWNHLDSDRLRVGQRLKVSTAQ